MIRSVAFVIILASALVAQAQKKIISIPVSEEIAAAYVDRVGELYILTQNGQIQKYDLNGKVIAVYRSGPAPTLFEPRDGSRLFAFFREDGKINYMTPSFEVYNTTRIDSAFVIDPWLVFTSGDHNLWILDAADQTLKRINPRTSALEIDVVFPKDLSTDLSNISFAREYQGFVFLLDEHKGIHIFNNMGRWLKTITASNLSYFNFIGEELYYQVGSQLVFINLHSGEQRQIELPFTANTALTTDERLYLIHSKSIDFFEFKP